MRLIHDFSGAIAAHQIDRVRVRGTPVEDSNVHAHQMTVQVARSAEFRRVLCEGSAPNFRNSNAHKGSPPSRHLLKLEIAANVILDLSYFEVEHTDGVIRHADSASTVGDMHDDCEGRGAHPKCQKSK